MRELPEVVVVRVGTLPVKINDPSDNPSITSYDERTHVTITDERRGSVCILNLKGSFVGRPSVTVFERAVFDLLRTDQSHIILDLSELKFIDSAGLGAIIAAMVSVGRKEGALRLASLQGDVWNIVNRMNLNKVFEIYETVARAEAGLGKRKG